MAFEINLISKRISAIRARERLQWLIRVGSIIALVVFVVISSSVLSYFYFLKRKTETLDNKISQAEAQVKSLQEKETKVIYLNRKLTTLASILKLQATGQKQVEAVFALIPEGVSITGFNISEEQAIEISGEARDFSSLEKLFNNVIEGAKETSGDLRVGNASVESIEQGGTDKEKEEGYSFKIIISFNGTKPSS